MEKVYSFLRNHNPKLCVLSTATREGIPASAVVAYAVAENGSLVFVTKNETLKSKNLANNPYASFVTGWDFNQPNVQSRGKAFVLQDHDDEIYYRNIFYRENPFAKKFESPTTVCIIFTPEWIRFTDLTAKPMSVEEFAPGEKALDKRQRKVERAPIPLFRN